MAKLSLSSNADHPWLQNAKKAPDVSLGETVRARLKQFSLMNKLKKRALRVKILCKKSLSSYSSWSDILAG